VHAAAAVTPAEVDGYAANVAVAEAEQELGRTDARVSVAAVDLRDRPPAPGEVQHGGRADRGAPEQARERGRKDPRARPRARSGPAQIEPEERAPVRRAVPVEERRRPLVGDCEIDPAVAVDVGRRDAAADEAVSESDLACQVDEPPLAAAD